MIEIMNQQARQAEMPILLKTRDARALLRVSRITSAGMRRLGLVRAMAIGWSRRVVRASLKALVHRKAAKSAPTRWRRSG